MPSMTDVVLALESGNRRYGNDGRLLTSPKGAEGEMQVMPDTQRDPGFGVRPADLRGSVDDQADEKARVGRDYIAAMTDRYGSRDLALAAYNAGPGRLDEALKKGGDRWLDHLPAETRAYVARGGDLAAGGDAAASGGRRAAPSGGSIDDFLSARNFAPPAETPKRTWGEVATDTAKAVAGGAAGLVKFGGDVYGLASGDMENPVSELGKNAVEYWDDSKSQQLKDKVAARRANIDAAPGLLGKFAAAAGDTIKDPALLADALAENVATLLPGLGAGKVAMGLKEGAALAAGPITEAMAAEAAKQAAKLGVKVGVGVNAVQQGADSASSAYDDAMKKPEVVWRRLDAYKERVAAGEDPMDVKRSIATAAARLTFPASAAISVAANAIPGSTLAERALLGGAAKETIAAGTKGGALKSALKAGLGEAGQETIEEGGGQFAANVAEQQLVDREHDLSQGVGENAGMGAAAGLGTGLATGGFHSEQHAPTPGVQPAAEQPAAPPQVDPATGEIVPPQQQAQQQAPQQPGADPAAAAGAPATPADAFDQTLANVRDQLQQPGAMDAIRAKFGPSGTNLFLSSLTQAGNPNVSDVIRAKHLQAVEEAIFAAHTTRADDTALAPPDRGTGIGYEGAPPQIGLDTRATGGIRVDTDGLAFPETRADVLSTRDANARADALGTGTPWGSGAGQPGAPDVPRLGYDTTPTGRMRVDAEGNAVPETRADALNTQQAVEEARSLGLPTPRGGYEAPPAPTAGDAIRATKQGGGGPLATAVNAGIEQAAQHVDAGLAPPETRDPAIVQAEQQQARDQQAQQQADQQKQAEKAAAERQKAVDKAAVGLQQAADAHRAADEQAAKQQEGERAKAAAAVEADQRATAERETEAHRAISLTAAPDAAFSDRHEQSILDALQNDEWDGQPVPLAEHGFTAPQIQSLQRAGLADADGGMLPSQFKTWSKERETRAKAAEQEVAAKAKAAVAPKPSPAAAPSPTPAAPAKPKAPAVVKRDAAIAARTAAPAAAPTEKQQPGDIAAPNGKPFGQMHVAMSARTRAGEDTHDIVKVDGGLVVRPRETASEVRPASGWRTVNGIDYPNGVNPADHEADARNVAQQAKIGRAIAMKRPEHLAPIRGKWLSTLAEPAAEHDVVSQLLDRLDRGAQPGDLGITFGSDDHELTVGIGDTSIAHMGGAATVRSIKNQSIDTKDVIRALKNAQALAAKKIPGERAALPAPGRQPTQLPSPATSEAARNEQKPQAAAAPATARAAPTEASADRAGAGRPAAGPAAAVPGARAAPVAANGVAGPKFPNARTRAVDAKKAAEGFDDLPFSRSMSEMEHLAQLANGTTNENRVVRIGPVAPEHVSLLRQAGLPVDDGYTHTADLFAVRHAMNRHSDEGVERGRQQLPLRAADIAAAPSILAAPDALMVGVKNRRGQDVVGYVKRLPDGTVMLIEEVRTGRKTLALLSARRYPGATDFESIKDRILPSNARSDAGDVRIVYLPTASGQGGAALSRADSGSAPAESARRQAEVQQLATAIAARWKNAPKIVVVPNLQHESVPEAARATDAKQQSQGASGDVRGIFHDGTVYLLSDQLPGAVDVMHTLFHESLGHYGLRGVFGPKLGDVLDKMARLQGAKVRAKAEQYGLDINDPKQRRMAAEEVLAEMAEQNPTIGWVKQAVAAIRTWLREHVPGFAGMKLSDAEVIQNYLMPARAWVKEGGREFAETEPTIHRTEASFSRATDTIMAGVNAAADKLNKGPQIAGRTSRAYTAQQRAAMQNVGFEVTPPTIQERTKALWQDAGKKLAQGLVDQFAPIKDIDASAYGLLRLSKGAAGAFQTLLEGGRLKIEDGVYNFDESKRGGVIDRLLKPLQNEGHDFFRWVAANRAERLMGEGKENLFTPDDIKALKSLADGTSAFDYTIQNGARAGQVTRDRTLIYGDALRSFNEFQTNVLDMAEESGLIDAEARQHWEHEFYVPFYRVEDDGSIAGADIKNGAVRQQAFKGLTGRSNKLNADLLDNTLRNWAHLIDASAKNRAAKASIEAVEKMGGATQVDGPQGKGTVWFRENGEKRFSFVDDPYVLTAITSLQYAGMNSPIMKAMSGFKHALTVGVTASPFFKIRNLIRDSVQVIGTSNIGYNPVKNVAQGWKLTDPKSDEYFRLLAGGGTIHFGSMEGSEAKKIQLLVESGVEDSTILGDEQKLRKFYRQFIQPAVHAYNELGDRGEAINRATLYDQLIKQGVSHADATLQARDMMDFSMQGSFTTIRFLSTVVPFMNARLQGLYKLGKAAKEDPRRFSAVVGAAAVASIGLLAAYGDDDDWKKREEWDRNNFWWFKFGGTAFRIPKPFEIGAVATLAERGFELAFDREMTGTRFREQVMTLLGDNLSMNPIPQLVKPMLDVYANKDSFSGRPIENMAMQKLKSEYRFNGNTSMVARGASTAANAIAGLVGQEALSPVQIDQMLRGYFGWLGSFVVGAGDVVARLASDEPSKATPDYWKAATGGIVSDLRDAPSRYVSAIYQQADALSKAYATHQALVKEGKVDEAAAFAADHADDLGQYKKVDNVKKAEAKINAQVKAIQAGPLDPDEKRERIRVLKDQQDRSARVLAPS